MGKIIGTIATALAIVSLAITFVGAGLYVCMLPQTTALLSKATSDSQASPFSLDQLIEMAEATRAYTVDDNDFSALETAMWNINEELSGVFDSSQGNIDQYMLTEDAISHLDEVYQVVSKAKTLLPIIAIVAFASCILARVFGGRKKLARALKFSGLLIIIFFVALFVWAIIDFNGFFAAFHSLFFSSGSWLFSPTSLLICMYPTAFWIGMGIVWLATTFILSILAFVIGRKL